MKLSGMLVSMLAVVRSGLLEEAEFFGSSFSSSRFDAVGTVGNEVVGDPGEELRSQFLSVAIPRSAVERESRPRGAESMERSGEAQAMQVAAMSLGRLPHQEANEVVGEQVHGDFLSDHVRTLTAKHVHPQMRLETAKVEFHRPAIAIEGANLVRRVFDRIQKGGDHDDRPTAESARRLGDADLTNRQRGRELFELVLVDSTGWNPAFGSRPGEELIVVAQAFPHAKVRGTSLMQSTDRKDAALLQTSEIHIASIRTIPQDHVTRLKVMPETTKEGDFVGNDGVDDHVDDGPGGPTEQGHELGDGKSAPWPLSRRLGEDLLQRRRVRHAHAGTVHGPDATPSPPRARGDQIPHPQGEMNEQLEDHLDRQAPTSLTVGRGIGRRQRRVSLGRPLNQQRRHRGAKRLGPVQDLPQKRPHGHGGVPERRTPDVSRPSTE